MTESLSSVKRKVQSQSVTLQYHKITKFLAEKGGEFCFTIMPFILFFSIAFPVRVFLPCRRKRAIESATQSTLIL